MDGPNPARSIAPFVLAGRREIGIGIIVFAPHR
jgi:hypothetical protein